MTRAIIFDLDDTLYRERRWLLSGFSVVARELAGRWGRERDELFRVLAQALRRGNRRHALQRLCGHCDESTSVIPEMVALIRAHEPRIALSPVVSAMVTQLRRHVRVGVLTNGIPDVQRRKVSALGVDSLVDVVTYAAEHGGGKPNALAFEAVADRLGVEPRHAMFVGDDPVADIAGARALGMRTVRVNTGHSDIATRGHLLDADHVVGRVEEVAEIASFGMPLPVEHVIPVQAGTL